MGLENGMGVQKSGNGSPEGSGVMGAIGKIPGSKMAMAAAAITAGGMMAGDKAGPMLGATQVEAAESSKLSSSDLLSALQDVLARDASNAEAMKIQGEITMGKNDVISKHSSLRSRAKYEARKAKRGVDQLEDEIELSIGNKRLSDRRGENSIEWDKQITEQQAELEEQKIKLEDSKSKLEDIETRYQGWLKDMLAHIKTLK